MLGADAVAVLWGDRVLGAAADIIPVAVVISTLGAASNGFFGNTRLIFTAARDKNIPDVLSYIQVDFLTPICAMGLLLGLALLFLVPAEVGTLINYIGFLNAFFNGLVYICFLVFRFGSMRDAHRPIKIPLVVPIFMVILNIYMFVAPLAISPEVQYAYVAAGVFLGSAVIYVPFIFFRVSVPFYDRIVPVIQLCLRVSPPAKYED
ncbi:b(0,+)-type amino acid transporter 1-like [Aplysia californica]|uniref:B(0,+)-type amino acid transporter 1-like n=1 Tax=Aplysia californica TaxID=6500 RepID=A0ABM1AFT4_APLCA|nr:b(0,+)-type amino acid transporter 1-like [Aplysia californica]